MESIVSIIVPVYNCEKYLVDCFNSIERQTYKNIEVIIINDGSKDNGKNIINDYLKKHRNWILLDQKNQGLSVSRNNGLEKSKGDYIFFLDSDDYISDKAIEVLVKKATQLDSDIVIGKMINFNSTGLFPNYTSKYLKTFSKIDYHKYPQLLSFVHAAGKLYRRKIIENVKFIPHIKHEDNYFNLTLFLKTTNISMILDDVYYHRIREGNDKSITQNLNYSTFKDLLLNYEKLIDENDVDKTLNVILSRKMINYIYVYVKKDERKNAKNDMKILLNRMDRKNDYNFLVLYRKVYELMVRIVVTFKR